MVVAASSAGAAAAAAGAAARRAAEARKEEEEMTPYTREDLSGDWEFKILRSYWGAFGKPATLEHVLAEERRAGWVLIEKFDDHRVRLKRPAAMRKGDAALGFDPYRAHVVETAPSAWIVTGLVGSLILLGAIVAAVLLKR